MTYKAKPSSIKLHLPTSAPIAEKRPTLLEKHGDQRIDPYYWLNQREDPQVIAYLEAENTYREQAMSALSGFQDTLFKEIVGRIKKTDMSVPYRDNGFWYLTRVEENMEYPIYSRKKDQLEAEEEILLDVNQLAAPHAYYQVGGRAISHDNRILAFGEDTVSRRIFTIRFKDLKTGELLPDQIPNTTGQAVWAKDHQTVFYTTKDDSLRPFKVFRHRMGTPVDQDVEVYHEQDETFHCQVFLSTSKEMILIGSEQTVSSEYWFLPSDTPLDSFRLIQARQRDLEYEVDHLHQRFVIRTNWQARNFRLMSASPAQPGHSHWTEIVPHQPDILIEDTALFDQYLVIQQRVAGISQLYVRTWDDPSGHTIQFGEDAYVAHVGHNPDPQSEELRLVYTSMTTPISTYDYHMGERILQLKKEEEVVGGYDKSEYTSERLMAKASDGISVPLSLVYRKGARRDSGAPLLLYGYGSYGISIDPYFSSARLSLLDRGFIFAIAHIRGGEDLGRPWYEDGRQLKKMNSFTDFIACAEHLIAQGYTSPGQLYAMGGSAGGLLMGAVMNLRPELWHGVIAAVPFVDVLTTMLDDSIPLTTGEYDEWGNPNDPIYYHYMKSYSPYDQVEAKDYPTLLVTTGIHDSQVQYWEPAKWVAKLRDMKTDQNPLLLYCNMDTGHGGASGRFERHRETAMEYAFLLDLAGMQE
ncbi:MAG: S9 family peptidase [Lewinellaceae bacterium]|nr:S9 family peptidase [Saprospiraceae bacterium]MCB9311558.1 S9 family peptidase [Lewinellaceae bacterium]